MRHPHTSPTERRPRSPQDALEQAMSCLNTSGQRLKREDLSQTDEVLNLLQAALAHLQHAAERPAGDVSPGLPGAE